MNRRLRTYFAPHFRSLSAAACVRVACACAVLVVAGCGSKEGADAAKQGPGAGGPPPALPVSVLKVEPRQVPIALEAVGQAEGSREVEIRARVSGILEKRVYDEGSQVKAGAVLFQIDRKPYELAVEQAKSSLGEARARLENARREADRLKALAQSKAISQREYDQAASTLQESSATIEGAKARLSDAELNLSYTNVTAPISGITGRAVRSEGSLVAANTDTALLTTLTQVNPIWVRFSLSASEYERIRGAKRMQVKLLSQDNKVTADNGRINFTGSTVDPKLGTVQLRAEFPNADLRWLPGQFVKVAIQAGEQRAYLVPQVAVMQTEQGNVVWVVNPDNTAAIRPIQTANWLGQDWIVTGGLNPGEGVIVDNLMKIRPGAKVMPHPPGAAPQGPGSGPQQGAGAASADKQGAGVAPADKQGAGAPSAKGQSAVAPSAQKQQGPAAAPSGAKK